VWHCNCTILRLAVSVEHRLVTDGRTNGQTDRRWQHIYRASTASRGKYRCYYCLLSYCVFILNKQIAYNIIIMKQSLAVIKILWRFGFVIFRKLPISGHKYDKRLHLGKWSLKCRHPCGDVILVLGNRSGIDQSKAKRSTPSTTQLRQSAPYLGTKTPNLNRL